MFDVTGLRAAFVEGVVIDLDRESVATIAGLRQVFHELRIVALSSSPHGGGLGPPRRGLDRDHEADIARARRGARRAAQLALGAHRTDFA